MAGVNGECGVKPDSRQVLRRHFHNEHVFQPLPNKYGEANCYMGFSILSIVNRLDRSCSTYALTVYRFFSQRLTMTPTSRNLFF